MRRLSQQVPGGPADRQHADTTDGQNITPAPRREVLFHAQNTAIQLPPALSAAGAVTASSSGSTIVNIAQPTARTESLTDDLRIVLGPHTRALVDGAIGGPRGGMLQTLDRLIFTDVAKPSSTPGGVGVEHANLEIPRKRRCLES